MLMLWIALGIYVLGFAIVLWLNTQQEMITLGLALLRSAVWPIWITTGWPRGEPLPMD